MQETAGPYWNGSTFSAVGETFFAMGFGYAVVATSLGRPVRGMIAAWIGFAICLLGTLMAAAAVLSGRASVLYTFYPPLLASRWYYVGFFLLVGGSMIWVVLMIVNMMSWKNENPGQAVPLAMFAVTATALLWAWSASGVLLELLVIIFPAAIPVARPRVSTSKRRPRAAAHETSSRARGSSCERRSLRS